MPHKMTLPILRKREHQRFQGRTREWRPGARKTTKIKDKCTAHSPHNVCLCNDFSFCFSTSLSQKFQKGDLWPMFTTHACPETVLPEGAGKTGFLWFWRQGHLPRHSLCGDLHRRKMREQWRRGILREAMSVHDVLNVYIVPHTELKA